MVDQDRVPAYAQGLGWSGLLPFIGLSVLVYLQPYHGLLWADVLSSYALAIICFLVGVWWGLALIRRSAGALVLSNVVVIVAFFGHVVLPVKGFLILCALLFPTTALLERWLPLFRPQPAYYASLRMQLTLVATVSLVWVGYRL